MTNLPND